MTVTPIYLTFLNYLGGFEYFLFSAEKEFDVDVKETGQSTNNLLPNWPNSYGPTADTIRKQTFRDSVHKVIVRSQHLSENQRDVLKYIRTSPLVQIVVTRTDRRTVIVDNDSFKVYDEGDKLFTTQFAITYTDDIPSQRV